MYMQQCIEKARHKQLEQKAREDRRKALALQTGVSAQELAIREAEQELLAAKQAENKEDESQEEPAQAEELSAKEKKKAERKAGKKPAKKEKKDEEVKVEEDVFEFDDDDDDLF